MAALAHHFEEGGWGMYPILACCVILLGIALERAWFFTRPREGGDDLVERLAWAIRTGDAQRALALAVHAEGPAARIARAALLAWSESLATIESAIDAQVDAEIAPYRRRVPVLQGLAAVATLFGLWGTVTGLFVGGHSNADAASRATMLARGISEAMNCTAFGLFVSLFAVLVIAMTRGGASAIESELRATAQSIRNLMAENRPRLRWDPAPPRATYRDPG